MMMMLSAESQTEMEQVLHVQDCPGYYYNWIAPLQQWGMKWHPIKDTYCPPQLDHSLQWVHLAPPQDVNMIPLLGDGEMHCQHMAQEIGATYLYYRQDLGKIEIWAHNVSEAMTKMSILLQKIKERRIRRPLLLKPKN